MGGREADAKVGDQTLALPHPSQLPILPHSQSRDKVCKQAINLWLNVNFCVMASLHQSQLDRVMSSAPSIKW